MVKTVTLIVAFVLLAVLPVPAYADDYAKGIEAYEARNFDKARKVFEALAKEGGARAQYRIGAMYDLGIGAAADHATALEWYRKAAAHGRLQAYLMLAISYRDGAGVPKDLVLSHVFASIPVREWGKLDLAERDKLSKQLAAILTKEQRAESEELQSQSMVDLERLPIVSKTGQKQGQ
jgi:Sel1 repeat